MTLPLPPMHLRRSVGPVEDSAFQNPGGGRVFGDLIEGHCYRSVFDFGCGCGRIARQLLEQGEHRPERYLGIDLFKESIDWCEQALSPQAPGYRFLHHDVYNKQFNPDSRQTLAPFPTEETFSLVNAHSVFTHIIEDDVAHYVAECRRVLESGGVFRSTWFLFDKRGFPMMQTFQNSLYINTNDPTNAVIYDYRFVEALFAEHGMVMHHITPPAIRGFQWQILASLSSDGLSAMDFPEDVAPLGLQPPPVSIR